jgi:hypothetical protein
MAVNKIAFLGILQILSAFLVNLQIFNDFALDWQLRFPHLLTIDAIYFTAIPAPYLPAAGKTYLCRGRAFARDYRGHFEQVFNDGVAVGGLVLERDALGDAAREIGDAVQEGPVLERLVGTVQSEIRGCALTAYVKHKYIGLLFVKEQKKWQNVILCTVVPRITRQN